MASKLPEVKKKISGFFLEENGRITKQSMLSLGAIMAGAAMGAALPSKLAEAQTTSHTHNHASANVPKPKTTHSSHSSHNSY